MESLKTLVIGQSANKIKNKVCQDHFVKTDILFAQLAQVAFGAMVLLGVHLPFPRARVESPRRDQLPALHEPSCKA